MVVTAARKKEVVQMVVERHQMKGLAVTDPKWTEPAVEE